MQINLKVDSDRFTLDDMIALEDGNLKMKAMRDMLARFVSNGNGEYMPEIAARKTVGALTLRELRDVMSQFADNMKQAQAEAVPPMNAEPSSPPSGTTGAHPDGSAF